MQISTLAEMLVHWAITIARTVLPAKRKKTSFSTMDPQSNSRSAQHARRRALGHNANTQHCDAVVGMAGLGSGDAPHALPRPLPIWRQPGLDVIGAAAGETVARQQDPVIHSLDGHPLALRLVVSDFRSYPVKEVMARHARDLGMFDPQRSVGLVLSQALDELGDERRLLDAMAVCAPGETDRRIPLRMTGLDAADMQVSAGTPLGGLIRSSLRAAFVVAAKPSTLGIAPGEALERQQLVR